MSELKVNTISEVTGANGVVIDSTKLKDGGVIIADAGNIGSASDTDALAISSGGVVTFTQKPVINSGVAIDNITIDGTEIDLSSGDLTLDVAGDIILDADGGDVKINDGGTAIAELTNSSTDFVIKSITNDKDLIFKGVDNSSAITALTLDMSDAGTAVFNHDIRVADGGQIGSASDADAMTIASGGAVTFTQTPVFPDGSLALADLDIDGGTDIGAAIVDADLFIVDDGAGGTNRKTTAARLKTYIGGGITMAQMWRLNTSFTGDEQPISSNLEAVDTDAQGNIGSAMTESSGIFTFPSTGYYLVSFNADFYLNAESRYNQAIIEVTENNSSYSEAGKSSSHINVMNSGNSGYASAFTQVLLDISDTSNRKVRFTVSVDNGSVNTAGNTDYNRTWMSFIRLGDT